MRSFAPASLLRVWFNRAPPGQPQKHTHMNDEDILNREKWVRVMCDYYAEGVWDAAGRACSAQNLPVSQDIRNMLLGWQAWFDWHDPAPPSARVGQFDHAAHNAFGLFIARRIKEALPDWTVVFFDELKGDRDSFQYEITLDSEGRFGP
ncbi:MAG: hypothetical protein KGL46_04215 [Hyphomicrobiales bacterium]|nr:hypothetical protein [Hyphomicrobiales bacterium]